VERSIIKCTVSLYFCLPKVLSCFWPFEEMAVVPVPKTTMNKDYSLILGEYKIWFARKALVVENVTEAFCMQAPPDNHFGFRIFSPDAGHHPASYLGRNDVSHE